MTAKVAIANLKKDFPDYYISLEIIYHYFGFSKDRSIRKMYSIAIRPTNGKIISTNQKTLLEADKIIREIMKCQ